MVKLNMALFAIILLLPGCEKMRLDNQVRELCTKDGGIKVYETVKLTKEEFDRWNKDGFKVPEKSNVKEEEYFYEWDIYYYQQGNPSLSRSQYRIIRRNDGKVMGESVRYSRGGGDLPGPGHESSFTCPPVSKDQPALETSIFIKESA